MENGKHLIYEFGGFQLDPRRHTLFRQGQPLTLSPKLFETLVLLVENRDRILPKNEMMQTLWAETFVEEGNLSQNIFLLRKALGDDRNGHSFIHTIPRRGYRFVAPVAEIETHSAERLPGARDWEYWKKHSPFRSLTVFDEEDAWLFFGREAETAELVGRVERSAVVAVVGNSGSGKSSLLRAGLLPALREGRPVPTNGSNGTHRQECWRTAVFRPSAAPFDYVAEVLPAQLAPELSAKEQVEFIAECRGKLPADVDCLRNAIAALVTATRNNLAEAGHTRVLLVVDHFEELFTLTHDGAIRDRYIDSLLAAARTDGAVPVHVVLSLRADFFGHCLDHRELRGYLASNLLTLGSMTPEQMRETIEKRLRLAGGRAEPGLIDALLQDVGAEPGNLALLEHALGELWEQCGGPGCTFTNQAYSEMGRLRGALGRHADAVLESLDEEQQHLAQKIFLELVHLGEGAQDTRRRVAKGELLALGEIEQAEQLLAQLASSRLIAIGREGAETFVEVSHEALIREWSALREWLVENREDLSLEHRLGQAAEEWASLNRDPGALLQGARLAQAEDWFQRRQGTNKLLRDFVQASTNARAEAVRRQSEGQQRELGRQKQTARRFRAFSYALAVLLLVASGSAWIAYRARILETSRAMAAEAVEMRMGDHGRALILAIRSWQTAKTDQAHMAVAKTFPELLLTLRQDDPVNTTLFSPDGSRILSLSRSSSRLWDAHNGRLIAVLEQDLHVDGTTFSPGGAAFSPDGVHLVTAGTDNAVRVWNSADGRQVGFLAQSDHIQTAAFSPDGKLIITGGTDKLAYVWDWKGSRAPLVLKGHASSVEDAQFSPDGKRIVTASRDKTARVWDSVTGRQIAVLRGHTDMLNKASFSPDGRYIVTAAADTIARVWNSADYQLHRVLQHGGGVESARFSPNGKFIATASFDNAARIWNVDDGQLVATLRHDGPVEDICFSADAERIVTASHDRTARVWNSHNGRLLAILQGHTGQVFSAWFSPSGTQVVTGGQDKTVRIWNLSAGAEINMLRHQAMVTGVEFSPDGGTFMTVSTEPEAHLWNSADARLRGVLGGHSDRILRAMFSPDGKKVVTCSYDGTARVWALPDARLLMTLQGHTGTIISASFSPDSRRIVTASWDHTARIWRSEDGQLTAILQGHTRKVQRARFSPDSQRVITASDDGTARVWSALDGHMLLVLQHADEITDATFSPDGQRILTASADKTARLWNAADGRLLAAFQGHSGPLASALFSPDGRRLLTFGYDPIARLWDTSNAHLVANLVGHTDEIFSAQFSLDSRHILTASADNTARMWNGSDGHLEHTLQGHTHQVIRAAFFPDGRRIITASLDQTARIWEILTLDDIERILSQ